MGLVVGWWYCQAAYSQLPVITVYLVDCYFHVCTLPGHSTGAVPYLISQFCEVFLFVFFILVLCLFVWVLVLYMRACTSYSTPEKKLYRTPSIV